MAKITQDTVARMLEACGGAANVLQAINCMTRLRLTLREKSRADLEAIRALPGVLGIVTSDEQLQIVLGPGEVQAAEEMMNRLLQAAPPASGPELREIASDQKRQIKEKQTNPIQKFLARFATIFTPLIPGFIAAGLLLGFATLGEQLLVAHTEHPSQTLVDLFAYMKVFSKGLFTFLSILIGYNAQKEFGGSGVNGAIIASLFVLGYNAKATVGFYSGMSAFFGHAIDPRGNIIGVLIAAILGAWVEKRVRRMIAPSLDMILTSGITLLIMGAVTFLVIMPVGGWLFSAMSWLFLHLNGNPLGAAVLAGLFLFAVMFGVHQGFVPVYFALMDAQGFNSLFPILAMAGAGQVGAALALFVRAKKGAMLRTHIKGAIIPGLLGVGEPLIYGVTLPRVKPFVTACLGGAAGGFFIGLLAWLGLPMGMNTVFGPSGLVALPLMTSHAGIFVGMAIYALGLLVAYAAGFVLTWAFGSRGVDLS
jgi:N-acetylmuramic acid-specific PTS system IIC component